jgi:hypothetical protein
MAYARNANKGAAHRRAHRDLPATATYGSIALQPAAAHPSGRYQLGDRAATEHGRQAARSVAVPVSDC